MKIHIYYFNILTCICINVCICSIRFLFLLYMQQKMKSIIKQTIKKRINLWTQPRSSSTSLMYSFKSRGVCSVVDEPLNYFKLAAIGLPTGSFAGLCGKLHVMMNISIYILLFSNPI